MCRLVQLELNFKRYFVRTPGSFASRFYPNSYIELDEDTVTYFYNDREKKQVEPIEFLTTRLNSGRWVEVDSLPPCRPVQHWDNWANDLEMAN